MSPEQRAVLVKYGYDPDLPPRGISGGPEAVQGFGGMMLRNHVCYLDGVEVDGHEASDLDEVGFGAACLHCQTELGVEEET